jgi:hypothetical protein
MMSFKFKSGSIIGLSAAIVLSFVSSCGVNLPLSGPEPERNVLTNLVGNNRKVIAVKIDDTSFSHPQEGLTNADVIFVTQVEAGLTRLMAIYTDIYPTQVGPVRSARISDIDILAQFGKVGFMYSGAQSKLRPVLESANLVNLSAERNPPSIYVTDPARKAPYAMMVKIDALLPKADEVETVKSVGWKHGKKSEFARSITSARVDWPNATYEMNWDQEKEKFLLDFDGKPNFGSEGKQLGSNMMIIQIINIHPSQYGDKFGGVTPKNEVVGNGRAFLLRDGTATEVRWSRPTADSPTEWTLPDGSSALFADGQVWIFLTDQEPVFAYPPAEKK